MDRHVLSYLGLALMLTGFSMLTIGCSDDPTQFRVLPMDITPVPTPYPAPVVHVYPATPLDCQYGGTKLFVDGLFYNICNGAPGAVGSTGADGAVGPQGVAGENGSNGSTGANGTNGTNGSDGSNGVNGTNGTDGTVITPVQFCPGGPSTYSGVFAESGLCIDNQMYGVYSANGGFLALLPPGSYSSDGINDSCTFTILANCGVSH